MNWKARLLVSCRVIVALIGATTTDTGLTVRRELDGTDYPKGIVVSDREMNGLNISRDAFHGEWTTPCNQTRRQSKHSFPDEP